MFKTLGLTADEVIARDKRGIKQDVVNAETDYTLAHELILHMEDVVIDGVDNTTEGQEHVDGMAQSITEIIVRRYRQKGKILILKVKWVKFIIEWTMLEKRRINKSTYLLIVFGFQIMSCSYSNRTCFDLTQKCYLGTQLVDSLTNDTLNLRYSISGDNVYIINDYNYEYTGILYEFLFLDSSLGEGSSLLIPSSNCFGKLCDSLSYPGNGYIIVMLKKENDTYYFKHIVVDTVFNSLTYLDSTQIYKVNEKPIIGERYYKMELTPEKSHFKYYRNVEGVYKFRFSY